MQVNRGLVFWGVALITAGAVALAIQAGAIDGDAAQGAWQFWPVVLIAIGVAVIAARTPFAFVTTLVAAVFLGALGGTLVGGLPDGASFGCSGETDTTTRDGGPFNGVAEVTLELNCGELDVRTASGSSWSLDAGHADGEAPEVEATGSSLTVRAEGAAIFPFGEARQAWELTLPTDSPLSIDADMNAASSRLDLEGADLTRLSLDANAGDLTLDLSGASAGDLEVDANAGSVQMTVNDESRVTGSVGVNAGSLALCAPDGVGIAITISDGNITFSHNLDESGLTQQGDTYRTDEDPTVTLEVEGNAGSFTLNPEDGCS